MKINLNRHGLDLHFLSFPTVLTLIKATDLSHKTNLIPALHNGDKYLTNDQVIMCVLPPQQRRGGTHLGTHSPGGEGDGGSIFWKTREIGLPSYSKFVLCVWSAFFSHLSPILVGLCRRCGLACCSTPSLQPSPGCVGSSSAVVSPLLADGCFREAAFLLFFFELSLHLS